MGNGVRPRGWKSINQHAIASFFRTFGRVSAVPVVSDDIKRGHARGYHMGVMFMRWQGEAIVNVIRVQSRLGIRPLIASGVPTRLGVDTRKRDGKGRC
jgi:hypothetical protein